MLESRTQEFDSNIDRESVTTLAVRGVRKVKKGVYMFTHDINLQRLVSARPCLYTELAVVNKEIY